ncbi:hypothetical protein ACHAQA_009892 [Verticillium albo-atrum]
MSTIRKMSTISLANLQRISAKNLSELILAEQTAATDPTVAVVDVRDEDYLGGHIKGGINMPSATLDVMMPTLVRRMQDKKTVVFHCALSQQRGPSAALKYLRERDQMLRKQNPSVLENQTVYVLDLGFTGWQEVYGEDERLTEGYSKELWQNGY